MIRPWELDIQLNYQSEKAVYLQIADTLIGIIRSGRIKSGEALPSSRTLASQLKVNRNTVVEALQILINEEWVMARERKGIFVSEHLPLATKRKQQAIKEDEPTPIKRHHIVFDDGHPDSKIAPVAALARAYRRIFNTKAKGQMMGYTDAYGNAAFRAALAKMLNHHRAMHIGSEQICVTRGSQMALYLTAQCLLEKGDYVMIEDPGYQPAWQAFEHSGAKLLPLRLDREGLLIEDVIQYLKKYKKIKAIYITPHHQYPTTVTLSMQRRLELVRLSQAYGFTIIEDDYDNEFHFAYRPILPVCSLDTIMHYVYIGTMSKVVAPALRMGYIVSHPALLEKIAALRKIIDVQGDAIMEQAVLQLMEEGTISRHLKKGIHHYKAKRDLCATLIDQYLSGKVTYHLPEGGLAFWIMPLQTVNWHKIAAQLSLKGIKITPPDQYSYRQDTNGFRLSYGALSATQLKEGIKALGSLLGP
ncbi:PLP-dependent aminotransferase family protein [Taibaiella sp. KBW10]|uniref:MocR-like pyridoxine biosynthesis transcription factor PdxR n=1 Tax=Taibaiella sp. KBW10 TaxID=2153357 RepID=UPI000F5ADC1E|nr:PLP-dependent aminotransferase family protein [Taibaiella sp. KBW10]RQO30672.1 PLP-dependent aminotransferase family protein [Taibaiella sp. KBW10]